MHSSIREDVEALVRLQRRTTTPGERESAEWVARRLEELRAEDVRIASDACARKMTGPLMSIAEQ